MHVRQGETGVAPGWRRADDEGFETPVRHARLLPGWPAYALLAACVLLVWAASCLQPSSPLLLTGLLLSGLVFAGAYAVHRVEQHSRTRVSRAVEDLASTEERYRALVHGSSDATIVFDRNGVIQYVSPTVERMLGWSPDELIGTSIVSLSHQDEAERGLAAFRHALHTDGFGEPLELRILTADGGWRHTESVANNLLTNPLVNGIVMSLRDVSDRKRAEDELEEAQERFRAAFEQAPIGMALAGVDGVILRANVALGDMLGYDAGELVGMPLRDLTHHEDWLTNETWVERLFAEEVSSYRLEKRYLHRDGSFVWASVSVSLVRGSDGQPLYMVAQIEDITERKAIGERLAHAAIHDPLTGLPNRVLFLDRLALALQRAQRRHSRVAVIFVDLDRFKVINDSLGHSAGDRLLVAVADRLRGALRPSDTVARFGGDEFTVLCDDVTDESVARELADRMSQALARPFTIPDGEVFVTASLGIAISGPDDTPETMLRDSDAAMYRAKDGGRARVEVSDARNLVDARTSLHVGNALHRALDQSEFEVHYQPVVDLRSGRVRGFEALLRWQHPERGLVGPTDFISLTEEMGLIVPIGMWVLEEACRQTAEWQARQRGSKKLSISVNLAPRQLAEPTLPAKVEEVLARTGIDPDSLWLEITESTLMHDAESAVLALRALRSLGVHLAVDDFGTGYSSLSYLKRFPVESLKIDRSFVDGLGREPGDTAIVGAVVSLAHALDLVAVAEGLEQEAQLGELRTLGCDYAQGFLFGGPQSSAVLGPDPVGNLLAWQPLGGEPTQ